MLLIKNKNEMLIIVFNIHIINKIIIDIMSIKEEEIDKSKDYTGILVLKDNITYGRKKNSKGKEGKLFYGVIPSDKSLIYCKVPYEIDFRKMGNERYVMNKYVSYKYIDVKENVRSECQIVENYGNVNDIDAFIKYECKRYNLHISSSFKSLVKLFDNYSKNELINLITNKYFKKSEKNIKDVITIDPKGCKDMDDAIGIKKINDHLFEIYICITNVPLWFDFIIDNYLNNNTNDIDYINEYNKLLNELLNELKNTTSVYLLKKVIYMIPKKITENYLSFDKGIGISLCLTLTIDITKNTIVKYSISNNLVNVKANYSYEDDILKINNDYKNIYSIIKNLNNNKSYKYLNEIKDSHNVVEYLMIIMNNLVGETLNDYKKGIYRCCKKNELNDDIIKDIPEKYNYLKNKYLYYGGIYSLFDNKSNHEALKITNYIHITSPMRRISDFVNITFINQIVLKQLDKENYTLQNQNQNQTFSMKIVEKIIENIDKITEDYRNSRKVSLNVSLFDMILSYKDNILDRILDGIIIEINDKSIVIYIKEFDRICKINKNNKIDNIDNIVMNNYNIFDEVKVKLFIFDKEYNLNKKYLLKIV